MDTQLVIVTPVYNDWQSIQFLVDELCRFTNILYYRLQMCDLLFYLENLMI